MKWTVGSHPSVHMNTVVSKQLSEEKLGLLHYSTAACAPMALLTLLRLSYLPLFYYNIQLGFQFQVCPSPGYDLKLPTLSDLSVHRGANDLSR